MAISYKELLHNINTLIFDVDGVFTDNSVYLFPGGEIVRKLNSRDAYAVQLAVKKGYRIAIITGGGSLVVKESLERLGVEKVFLNSSNKEEVYDRYLQKEQIQPDEVLYMGDDIPDYRVMHKSGVAACPSDAAEEIKSISDYVSNRKGGEGCVREIIEQVMKLQGKWLKDDAFEW